MSHKDSLVKVYEVIGSNISIPDRFDLNSALLPERSVPTMRNRSDWGSVLTNDDVIDSKKGERKSTTNPRPTLRRLLR